MAHGQEGPARPPGPEGAPQAPSWVTYPAQLHAYCTGTRILERQPQDSLTTENSIKHAKKIEKKIVFSCPLGASQNHSLYTLKPSRTLSTYPRSFLEAS